MKNLATIQTIKEVRPHSNADALSLATVLGWQVVIKKDEYKAGDKCVYVAIDTVLPDHPNFEFLRNKNFRIKPIRLRGEPSNGICFPTSILPENTPLDEGLDVTDIVKVVKYEKPIPVALAGQAFGHMPSYIIITDEDNLRSYPRALNELIGKEYYITRKDDGSSGTFFIKDEVFNVCSRRIHLKEDPNNGFWKMAHKYNIESIIREQFPNANVAIQGEIYGEGIQKNPLRIKGIDFNMFNIFDIDRRVFLGYSQLQSFSKTYNIPMVSVIDEGSCFNYNLNDLIVLANKQLYPTGNPAEGIVIRSKEEFYSEELKKRWSGKILNENYLE